MIVLVAVSERQVPISDTFNPEPLSTNGPQGIFAKVAAPTETRAAVEIVGLYSDLERAARGRDAHAKAHPGRRYVQKVAHLDDGAVTDSAPQVCIDCGTPCPSTRCGSCQRAFFAACRDADPLGGAPDPDTVAVPVAVSA
jgi:hypothetical protein